MKNLLTAHNLTLNIAHKKICQQLNLTVTPGDTWGILGPNGSGKTTLLHTLAGFLPAKSGDILVGEKNIKSLSSKELAHALGILLQDTYFHFPQTVFEFCLNGRYAHQNYFSWETAVDKNITLDTLKLVQLDLHAQQNILTLSGGERRRLAIATLLTQSPAVFLLDEPLNHLDLSHQIHVLNHFKKMASRHQHGIIMSLHDINFALHYCNKILMLFDNGEHLTGNPETLINEENLLRLYRHPIQNNRESWQPQLKD